MLRQIQNEIVVRTDGRGLYPITDPVQAIIGRSGLAQGLAVLHLQHTSAFLLIQEDADRDVRSDLDRFSGNTAKHRIADGSSSTWLVNNTPG
jgi:thiamine phosphate synthase YjbQ (UPF0047 family)